MKRAFAFAVLWVYATQLVAACSSPTPPRDERPASAVIRDSLVFPPPTVALDTVLPTQVDDDDKAAGSTVPKAWVSSTGAVRYTFPFWNPPGRAGVEPRLSLTYSSDAGNGVAGMGWSLNGLARISRCRKTVAIDGVAEKLLFDANDRFCLDGQRLMVVAGTYGADGAEYRTENDVYARIVSVGTGVNGPATFKMYTKDGLILTLGGDNSATFQQTVAGSVRALTWSLARVEDRSGNFLTVHYNIPTTSDEQVPVEIRYTGSTVAGAPPPLGSVKFLYELRKDVMGSYASGFAQQLRRRLRRVEMWGPTGQGQDTTILRAYVLAYSYDGLPTALDGSTTGSSVLDHVTECDGGARCRNPFTFTYAPSAQKPWAQGAWDYTESTDTLYPGAYSDMQSFLAADVNADGFDDLVYRKRVSTFVVAWFARYSNGTSFGAEQQLLGFPLPAAPNEDTSDARFTDWSGDGMDDFMVSVRDSATNRRVIHQLKSWGGTGFSHALQEMELGPAPYSFWTLDLNGDGLKDLLRTTSGVISNPSSAGLGYRLGPIDSGAPLSLQLSPNVFPSISAGFPIDLDGSGRTGLLVPQWTWTSDDYPVVVLDGSHYDFVGMNAQGGQTWTTTDLLREEVAHERYLFVDVNRDGLTDRLSYPQEGGYVRVHLNTGAGFATQLLQSFPDEAKMGPAVETVRPPEGWGNTRNSIDNGVRVADINGDGLADLVLMDRGIATTPGPFARTQARVLLSRGTSFVPALLPMPIGAVSTDRGMYRSLAMDVNGDGLTDFVQPDSGTQTLKVWIRQGVKPYLMRSATDALGSRAEFDYAPVTNAAVYTQSQTSCFFPLTCVRQGAWLASEMRADAGDGHPMRRLTYRYEDARSDAVGKGLLGMRKRTVTDHATGSITRETYTFGTRVGQRYPLARQLLSRLVQTPVAGGNTHAREVESTPAYVERLASDGTRYFSLYTAARTEREFVMGQQPHLWSVTRTVEDFDANFGNVKAEKWTWSDGYVTRRDTVYENRTAPWLVGLPTRVTETATTAQSVSRSRVQSSTYAPGTGLLTDVVVEPDSTDGDVYLATHLDYTEEGLRSGVTLRNLANQTRTTTFEYDAATRLFVSAIVNPAGHRDQFAYHPGLGVLAAQVDANGVQRRWQYDLFGRVRFEDGPTLSDISYEYLPGQVRATVAGGAETTVLLDSLGRTVKQLGQDFAGNPTEENHVYDGVGNLSEVQHPSPAGGTAMVTTRYQYDALGRLTRLTHPDETFQRVEYSGLTRTETNERGHVTTTEVNGRGWTQRVREPNPAGGLLDTTFAYGPFGVMTATEAVGRQSTLEYDVRGRRTRLSDVSSGVSQTSYNAFGDTRRIVDAELEEQVFTHDALGRVTQAVTPLGPHTYTWDTAAHGVGELASATSADGVTTAHVYDSLGRESQSSTQVDGATYTFDYTYDTHGRASTVAYPEVPGASRFQVRYGYTPRGELLDVREVASQHVYWQVGARTPSGHLRHAILGNGVESHYLHDDVGAVRLVETGLGTSDLQRLLYDYDAGGNVTSRNDGVAETTEDFGYDSLGRMTRWSVYQNCQRSIFDYGFSPDGNLTSRTTVEGTAPSETFVYGQNGAPPHAVTQGPLGSYGYDARGFRVSAPGSTVVQYTTAGLPHHIQKGTDALTFQYDAFASRVRKSRSNGDSSITVEGALYEKQVEGNLTRHVFSVTAGGLPVARVMLEKLGAGAIARSVAYLHRDPLGSVESLSNEQGALIARMKFDPFGRRVFPQALARAAAPVLLKGPHEGFTGQQHDDELGLIDMKGRIYDPAVGRFLSPDPFIQSPEQSQSHNRYSYVWNNPLRLVDPSGFMAAETCTGTGPDDIECEGSVDVLAPSTGGSGDPTIYGPYIGWQFDTWYTTGPDGRNRRRGATMEALEKLSPQGLRAYFRDNTVDGRVPTNFGTDEESAAEEALSDQSLLGMAEVMKVLLNATGGQAMAAVPPLKAGGVALANAKSVKQFGHTFSKHGAGSKKAGKLLGTAKGTGRPQGQWTDDKKAAAFLSQVKVGGPNGRAAATRVEIPKGLGEVIRPDGTTVSATHAKVIGNRAGGIRTAYPILP
ncbi:RHS repeat-associated core domain-containing protein [Corallococcus terminator]